jgi:hypothetical protein
LTEKERIEVLEKQVAELKEMVGNKKLVNNWQVLSNKVTEGLFEAFKTKRMDPHISQCKTSISCLVGKAFCKNNVNALTKEETEEAEPFIEYILNFMSETREKYVLKDCVSGYERKKE